VGVPLRKIKRDRYLPPAVKAVDAAIAILLFVLAAIAVAMVAV